jgi:hypothetical protein
MKFMLPLPKTQGGFPLWEFLNQPLFAAGETILNPIQFWNVYKLKHLERCWVKDYIDFLEHCWMQDLQSVRESDNQHSQ